MVGFPGNNLLSAADDRLARLVRIGVATRDLVYLDVLDVRSRHPVRLEYDLTNSLVKLHDVDFRAAESPQSSLMPTLPRNSGRLTWATALAML
jgi:hypothetical protein